LVKENKYLKALSRVNLNTEPDYSWSEEDKEHYLTIVEALEKQIPEKLTHEATKPKDYTCPRCKNVVNVTRSYCGICGQALKWEGVESDEC
jgi:hypothetical protein